jgi:hypothetical protein
VIEGIHPQVLGVSNAITRCDITKTNGGGSPFNRLLAGSLRYTDNATGGLESTARVSVEKLDA